MGSPTARLDGAPDAAELAGRESDELRRHPVAAIRQLPPGQGDPQVGQALHDAGHVVAAGADGADEEVRAREMGPVDHGGQARPDGADLLPESGGVGDAEQSFRHLHQAGDPPRPVGIEGDGPGRGVGDDRDRAEVLHRPDDLPPRAAGLGQAVVLGQKERPQPESRRRIVELKALETTIAIELGEAAGGLEAGAVGPPARFAGEQPGPFSESDFGGRRRSAHRSSSAKASTRVRIRAESISPKVMSRARSGSPSFRTARGASRLQISQPRQDRQRTARAPRRRAREAA